LLKLIHERFQVATEPELPPNCPPDRALQLRLKKNRELFFLCYNLVGQTSQRPLSFTAQYGLFRGLLTMFALLTLCSIVGILCALSVHAERATSLEFARRCLLLLQRFLMSVAVNAAKTSHNPSSTFSWPPHVVAALEKIIVRQEPRPVRKTRHERTSVVGRGYGNRDRRPSRKPRSDKRIVSCGMTNRFFDESKEQSLVKSAIVSKYFWAWAKVIMPRSRTP
jgi:hypothetical protein